ncbi:MAG: hypothetical protein ACRDL7_05985, partial [Gaiellaceae bacterium]
MTLPCGPTEKLFQSISTFRLDCSIVVALRPVRVTVAEPDTTVAPNGPPARAGAAGAQRASAQTA